MGAFEYANLIARVLNSCEYLDPRPVHPSKIEIPECNPPFSLSWKEKFTFRDSKILSVTDMATFYLEGNWVERRFMYDFRDAGSANPLFRICNHNDTQSINAPCHVHVNLEKNVVNCFSTSEGKHFPYVIHCIKNFYQNKPQDWEEGGDNEQDA